MTPEHYNKDYFDKAKDGGYSEYKRQPGCDADEHDAGDCGHEVFRTQAHKVFKQFNLQGKKVLDLGCAKGFHTDDLNDMGAICTGIDWSEITPKNCIKSDVLPFLQQAGNDSFDLIVGFRFLPCIEPSKLNEYVNELNRVGKQLFFTIDTVKHQTNLYNVHTLDWWSKKGFKKGTVLQAVETRQEIICQ